MKKEKDLREKLRKVIYIDINDTVNTKDKGTHNEYTGYFHMWLKRNVVNKDGSTNEVVSGLIEQENGKMTIISPELITFVTNRGLRELYCEIKDNETNPEAEKEVDYESPEKCITEEEKNGEKEKDCPNFF